MARIAMVLKGYIRYDGRVRKEIGTLVDAGHQVELIVSDFSKDKSGGEDLGINIHYLSINMRTSALGNFWEQIKFNFKAASVIKTLDVTHIHCHDLTSLLAGAIVKGRTRAKLVYDSHELMPESMGGTKEKIWNFIERVCIKKCDYIVMPEKNRIAYFKEKYAGITEPLLLENFPRKCDLPQEKFNIFRNIFPIKDDQIIVLYTGIVSPRRYIEELVESMAICREELVLIIMGRTRRGYEKIILKKIKDYGLENRVFLHDSVPHTEILKYMASCDIGTAFYRNNNINNYYCASNKLYEYVALGKVVLTNDYPGLLEVIGTLKQGICLELITPQNLAKAYDLATDASLVTPGRTKFFWEDQQDILIQLYEK